jgi:hypothetical protein
VPLKENSSKVNHMCFVGIQYYSTVSSVYLKVGKIRVIYLRLHFGNSLQSFKIVIRLLILCEFKAKKENVLGFYVKVQ